MTNGRPYNIITLALSERKQILERSRNDNFIEMMLETSGCGSVWLERLVWDQEAASSNLVTPTAVTTLPFQRKCGCSSMVEH